MILYERELNPEQLRVVLGGDGPVLVIAGAGSGKTRTLTYRVARLLESGVHPEHILLATFTNKAARTMLSRVRSLVELDIEAMWGGTFHHIAHRILRTNSPLLGYAQNFIIIDSEDATQLVNACIAEAAIGTKDAKFPKGDLLRDIISFSANTETPIEDVVTMRFPYFSNCLDDIRLIAGRYQARKKKENVIDFDDLLSRTRELLIDHPEVLTRYAAKFSHILVDEYQDTNTIQAEIVDLLASCHGNILAVGDDSQSIYAFRGANFANIIMFPDRHPGCRIFKLETNYRSTPEILHLANRSIENNEKQYRKNLRPVRTAGIRPVLIPLKDVMQQANFVAQRVLELVRDGVPLREIAVLFRAHYHSMELQMEMARRGIPFEIRSGIRFFEQAHIKDVTSYMRIVTNPFDELAWKRLFGLVNKIGKATSEKLWRYLSLTEDPLAAAGSDGFIKVATKTQREGLLASRLIIRRIKDSMPSGNPAAIIEEVLAGGYRDYLRTKYADAGAREDDLRQLAHFSARFSSLEDFLSELSLMTNMTEASESKPDFENGNSVVLSSIHQAKGLEWSVVLIIWCSDGMIPLARCLSDGDGEEEERRLFYVAITRAKDELYLCYPQASYVRGIGCMSQVPSRFIRELSSRHRDLCPYDQWLIEEDTGY
ncbi:MAG TPA: ATP-dependent helicase [Syntrophales bacterium]|nr:ATP-dependent helicase [Syntrophales bacterium]